MLKAELKKSINTVEFQVVCLVYMIISLYSMRLTFSADMDANYQTIRSADENFILMGTETYVWMYYLILIMPVLSALACALTKSRDDGANRAVLLVQRCGRRKYIWVKALTIVILNFASMVVPLLINLALCHVFYPSRGYDLEYNEPKYLIGVYSYTSEHFADMLRLEHPLAYNLLYIFIYGLFSVLMGLFAYGLSMMMKRSIMTAVVIPLITFLVMCAAMVGLNAVGLEKYSWFSYTMPAAYASSVFGLLIVVAVMLAVDAALIFRGAKKYEIC